MLFRIGLSYICIQINFTMKYISSLFLLLILAACGNNPDNTPIEVKQEVVNLYSHRHYDIDKELFKQFEEQTGIVVNVVKAGADELLVRLEQEGDKSPADLFITSDVGRLVRASDMGFFQPIEFAVMYDVVPAPLRDSENRWTGLTVRARILAYSPERVDTSKLHDYEDLANPEWKGRVLARSSSNLYNQSLLASIIANDGEEAALAWAKAVRSNMARAPKGSDRDQIKTIAAGEGDIAIVNTYYLGLLLNSENPEEVKAGESVKVLFPNQSNRGAHINISGAGLLKYSPNKENAIKLLEFLLSKESQGAYAEANYEYPVRNDVPASALLQSWGEFKRDEIKLEELGKNNKKAVETFNEAGWE